MRQSMRAGGLVLAGLLAITGCKRSETSSTPPPPVSAPAPAAAPLTVADVALGKSIGDDKSIAQLATEFAPTDTFYVSVRTTGAVPKATLTALWTYEDGQSVAESSEEIAPTGPATTEFHVSKPGGWPAGGYRVDVFLDGRAVGSKQLVVK